MLRNFLKIAYRNLFKYKYYAIINIFSFSIGLTAFIFSNIYTQNERTYDSFHTKANKIFRIVNVYEKDNTINKYATNSFPLAGAITKEFPDFVEQSVRLFNFQNNSHLVEYHDKHFNEKNFYYTDSTITKVFDFEFILGNKDSALQKPKTLIISQSIKEKYFGEFDPIGKPMSIDEGLPMIVTGVFKDFPEQSHVHPEILTLFSSYYSFNQEPDNWLWNPCWTYILLKDKIEPEYLEKKFPDFVQKYFDSDVKDFSSIYLQAITDIHLNSNLESELESNTKSLYINILLIISFFLLIVSWLNFINLSIVGSITRLREVSIRKILGSSKLAILNQFIAESILSSILAFLISLFLLELFIPTFNFFTHQNIQISRILNQEIFIKMFLIAIASGLMVGFYTGFYSTSFPTFNLGRFKHQLATKKWLAGRILIMLQYIISLIILIVVFVNFKQLLFFKNTNLGFDKENILIVPIANTPVAEKYEDFKQQLLEIPELQTVSAVNRIIGTDRTYRRYFYEDKEVKKAQFFPELIVRHDFIKALDIEVLAGTDFKSRTSNNEEAQLDELIINESMVKQLKYKNNQTAIQKKLVTFNGNERIIGVIKDFTSRSLHSAVSPLVIRLSAEDESEDLKYLIIKSKGTPTKKTLKQIEQLWKKYSANRPFDYNFLGDVLAQQYKNEDLLNFFLWIFSILIIVISCLGIWAVTSLLSIQRTKEIGIRKALGASVPEILTLFIKDFTNLLIIANLLAWPVAWILLNQWFKNFANHINIQWTDFIIASLAILALTLAIVTKQALKVANSNTIDSLRDE